MNFPKEIPSAYCLVEDSRNNSMSQINFKLDEITTILKNMNNMLLTRKENVYHKSATLPSPVSIPTRPTIPLPATPPSPTCLHNMQTANFDKPLPPPPVGISIEDKLRGKPPPPLPPKNTEVISPKITKDGCMVLTSSQCLCLCLQLKAVRMFIDENFEDEFVDKELNMNCLDSAIRTLSGH